MRCGAARQEPARPAATNPSTVCPACGAAIDDSMRFCMQCGAKLSPLPAAIASAVPVEPEPQRKRGMTKGAVAAIVAVLVVIAIAAFGVWWFVLRDDASARAGAAGTSLSGESSESSDSNDAGDATDSGDDDARGHASAEDESRTAVCTVPDA